jgi:hypothetical protein
MSKTSFLVRDEDGETHSRELEPPLILVWLGVEYFRRDFGHSDCLPRDASERLGVLLSGETFPVGTIRLS